jgi:membrane associated rhomboid family serine protease
MPIVTLADLRERDSSVERFVMKHKVTCGLIATLFVAFWVVSQWPEYLLAVARRGIVLREVLTAFIHANVQHVVLNGLAIYSLARIEAMLGSRVYLYTITYFLVMNALVIESINRFYETPLHVGFSGVIFGLLTLYPSNNIFGWYCNPKYFIVALLAVTQLLFANASFIGHLAGIISGYIYIGVRDLQDFEH